MNRHTRIFLAAGLLMPVVVMCCPATGLAQAEEGDRNTSAQAPKLETLLTAELEGADGTEVIVSRVTIPPNSSLPKHWHPGEEFAYTLQGSVLLRLDGEEIVSKAGEVAMIPLKKIHSATTGDEGAVVLVFRVHESGQPERHIVE